MAWISEIHYQNTYAAGSGQAEYVEVSLSPAEFARVSDFQFATYQSTGAVDLVVNLGTLTPVIDPDNGYYVYTINVNITAPDHLAAGGEAEALALVDNSLGAPVLSYYDIGGGTTAITATNGPAAGATSTNIAASAGGQSIQFDRNGTRIDGTVTPDSTVICFCAGSLIATKQGLLPVETLKPGTLVQNTDGQFVPLRWIGGRRVSRAALVDNPKLFPVRITAGALGAGIPARDLLVSRQHRILVCSKIAARVTGAQEVLVAAIKMTAMPGIFVDTSVQQVTYFHTLFDTHQIIFAEGAATESLFAGPEAMKSVSPAARAEIFTLFPELDMVQVAAPKRPIPDGRRQGQIIARHAKNMQPLQPRGR